MAQRAKSKMFPPAHIHPAPAAIISALRDPRAIPTLEEGWEALWESLYSFLGFPMRAGAILPTAMSTIKDGLGGNELPDTIRGIPDLWRNMKPLKTMKVCCSLLERLLDSPDRLQANITGKTIPGIAAVILEHFEFQLAAAESANASGVDIPGAGFVAHHHAPYIPLGFVIGTGAEFIPGAAPSTDIEHALSFLFFAAYELSGACIGYFEGRLSGSQPSVVTVLRGSTLGPEVGRNIAYEVGGSAMADMASVSGREAGSNAAKARGFFV